MWSSRSGYFVSWVSMKMASLAMGTASVSSKG